MSHVGSAQLKVNDFYCLLGSPHFVMCEELQNCLGTRQYLGKTDLT